MDGITMKNGRQWVCFFSGCKNKLYFKIKNPNPNNGIDAKIILENNFLLPTKLKISSLKKNITASKEPMCA